MNNLAELERWVSRAPMGGQGMTRAGKSELLGILKRRRTGLADAKDEIERTNVLDVFERELDGYGLAACKRDAKCVPLWSRDAVDAYGAFMLEKTKARRARGREPEVPWEISQTRKTFEEWHLVELRRVREIIALGQRFRDRDQATELKACVALLEALEAQYSKLELLWWPTVCLIGVRGGGLIELCQVARMGFDKGLMRAGAYAEDVPLPIADDEIPL